MHGSQGLWVGNMPCTIQKMAGAKEADVEVEPILSYDQSEQVLQCEFSVLNTNYILALTRKE
jgi:hypothetical protein